MTSATSPHHHAAVQLRVGRDMAAVPLLQPSSYASWRPRMEAYLMRMGLEEAYKDELASWTELHAKVREWDLASKARAISSALGRSSTASASSGPSPKKVDPEEENVKREVRGMVDRSLRAFGILHEAMTEELRVQTAHIPPGYAFGVWSWLEKKFQSTEVDCVNDLIEKWMELRMEPDEFFDNYRARVNKICVLLEQAKEKPSARIFAYKMLDMLQPRYRPAVLALKAGDKLRDPTNVNWEDVTAFINSHERSEHRLGMYEGSVDLTGEGPSSVAMSARSYQSQSSSSVRKPVQCFNCGEAGHISRFCKNPRVEDRSESEAREYEERPRTVVRKGGPGLRAPREEQVSMARHAPGANLGPGLNVAFGVRAYPPDDGRDSNRLSCEEKGDQAAEESKSRASRSGVGQSGVLTDPNVPMDAPSRSGVLSRSGVPLPLWNTTF